MVTEALAAAGGMQDEREKAVLENGKDPLFFRSVTNVQRFTGTKSEIILQIQDLF